MKVSIIFIIILIILIIIIIITIIIEKDSKTFFELISNLKFSDTEIKF